jgi:hypothetical protein
MTTKNELKSKKRHRYMLRGDVGSGKTHSLVLLAKRYASEGKHVLFIDYKDIGATEELEKLDDKTLELIDYETPANYEELRKTKMDEDVKLIVIDALHHLRFTARKHIREEFIKQGHYVQGGKTFNIEDENTFDLGGLGYGYGYGVANVKEQDIIDILLGSGRDIAVSVISERKSLDSASIPFTDIIAGYFDNIVDLSFRDNEDGKREWFYKLYRWRGIESNDYSDQPNNGEQDPFAAIERTGGKPIREFVVRYTVDSERKRMIVDGFDADEIKAQIAKDVPAATEVEVLE